MCILLKPNLSFSKLSPGRTLFQAGHLREFNVFCFESKISSFLGHESWSKVKWTQWSNFMVAPQQRRLWFPRSKNMSRTMVKRLMFPECKWGSKKALTCRTSLTILGDLPLLCLDCEIFTGELDGRESQLVFQQIFTASQRSCGWIARASNGATKRSSNV